MLKNGRLTYVSLFSSAGAGCYGFKMEDYCCIATNELARINGMLARCRVSLPMRR